MKVKQGSAVHKFSINVKIIFFKLKRNMTDTIRTKQALLQCNSIQNKNKLEDARFGGPWSPKLLTDRQTDMAQRRSVIATNNGIASATYFIANYATV